MARKGTLTVRIVGDARSFNDTLDSAADGLSSWAKGLGGIAAAGIGGAAALVTGTVLEALNRDTLTDQLGARFALAPAEAERLGQLASELYAGAWGESYEDVLDGLSVVREQLVAVGDVGEDTLRDVTAQALDLRTVFGVDLVESVSAVRAMIANGLAPDAESAMDILVTGLQGGVNAGGDFLEVLDEYGDSFGRLGLNGLEATRLLGQGIEAGAQNADRIADAIREFSIRAVEDTDAVADAFTDLGLDGEAAATAIARGGEGAQEAFDDVLERLRGIEDPVEQARLGAELFGSMWEDVGSRVILALDPVEEKIQSVDGAAQAFSDTTNDNLMTRITAAFRSIREYVINEFGPPIVAALERVEEAFGEGGLGGALTQLGEEWQALWEEYIRPWWDETVYPWLISTVVPQARETGVAIGEAVVGGIGDYITDPARIAEIVDAINGILNRGAAAAGQFKFGDLFGGGGGGGVSKGGGKSTSRPGGTSSIGSGGGSTRGGTGSYFHRGGVAEGPAGGEVDAVLMAGETVLPTHEGSGYMGGKTINVTVASGQAEDVLAGLRLAELVYG